MAVSVDMPEGLELEMDKEVGKGSYKSKSELIRDAVRRLLEERKKIEHRKISGEAQTRIEEAREDEDHSPEDVRKALGIEN